MEKKITEILPKIVQWESIYYAPDYICPKCGKSGHPRYINKKAKLIGWCETNNGFMAVFECTECFEKFMYHPQLNRFELKDFDDSLKDYIEANYFENSEELMKLYQE